MRPRDLVALEFPRVCARVADFAVSAAGREACRALLPTADRDEAEHRLDLAWQSFRLFEQHGDPPLGEFSDIRQHLRAAAHEGFVLDGKALVEVRGVLEAVRAVGSFLRRHVPEGSVLTDTAGRLRSSPSLETSLARALADDGAVVDRASDELAAVRATIRRLRETLARRLEELVSRPGLADVIADDYVTIRNNRFVVPVRASAAGRLGGVVQDRSISGETFFVEPLFAVELNNRLLLAVREEEAVVRRILADLTALVRDAHEEIDASLAALIEVDVLLARARFARTYRCTRPTFSGGGIELREARHPGLLFTGRPVTPIDIVLPSDRRVLVITGPNTGGKTVALKTLGLSTLMAQSGILVPAAEGARLPFVSAVFTDIGDDQNVERNLSTFSAHVLNLREIFTSLSEVGRTVEAPHGGEDPDVGRVDGGRRIHFDGRLPSEARDAPHGGVVEKTGDAHRSGNAAHGGMILEPAELTSAGDAHRSGNAAHGGMILMDEPGVGTDPDDGAALAVGLIQQLERLGAVLAITTHFTPVKVFALGHPTCTVAAVEFDVETLTAGYRLVYHSLGQSLALPIAERLGLPAPVLAAARAARSEQSHAFDVALAELEERRRKLERELSEAAELSAAVAAREAEVELLLGGLRERRRDAWQTELREARSFLRALKEEGRERLRSLRDAAEDRAAFHRFVHDSEDEIADRVRATTVVETPDSLPGPLRAGDTVEVGERGIRGELLSVEGARAWIQRGSLRFEVPAAELRRLGRPSANAETVRVAVASVDQDVAGEITLVGLRAREAVRELETFLDHAARARRASVRIVHGVGSGALRRAVQEYLSSSPYCSEFRSGEEKEGGAGVTVATMNV